MSHELFLDVSYSASLSPSLPLPPLPLSSLFSSFFFSFFFFLLFSLQSVTFFFFPLKITELIQWKCTTNRNSRIRTMHASQTLNSVGIPLDTQPISTEGTITRGVEGPKLKRPPYSSHYCLYFFILGSGLYLR